MRDRNKEKRNGWWDEECKRMKKELREELRRWEGGGRGDL